jgi:hypothetical protein
MTTALATITAALEVIGVLSAGGTPNAADSVRALAVFNNMLESWGTERQNIAALTTESLTLTGASSYTIGATGTLVTTRPMQVDPSSYITTGGLDHQLQPLSQQQYNAIGTKVVSGIPQYYFYDATYPNGTLYLYPNDTGGTLHLVSWKTLATAALLTTDLAFPPGYQRAIEFSLAEELVPYFNAPMPANLQMLAAKARRNIKRMNSPDVTMSMPLDLWAIGGRGGYNINTDA